MNIRRHLPAVIGALIGVAIVLGPQIYLQHKRLTEQQHEFMLMDVKSLESSLGVCKVIMESTNPDLQSSRDFMRDTCTKMQNELNDLNKKLENY